MYRLSVHTYNRARNPSTRRGGPWICSSTARWRWGRAAASASARVSRACWRARARTWRCVRAALPIMKQQGGGRVVNLIGNDGVKDSYWEIVPGACNAAGQNLTRALAGQYGRFNITFVAVNPGPVRTERWDGLVKAMARDMKLSYEEADRRAPRSIPLRRIAEVEEGANLLAHPASPLAHFVNGSMIEIDGGQQKPLMDAARG